MIKKLLTAAGVIVLALALFAAAVVLSGHYFKSKSDIKDYSNSGWMGYLEDDALLGDIAIPGSHDAGTCSMNWLGRTQGYCVGEQLDMGARYFDLRVNKTEDGYFMYHALFNGERFEDVLDAIVTFLQSNPTEVLILDFQHFKGGSEGDVLSMVEEALVSPGLAVRNESDLSDLDFISALRLADVRGKCVILFGSEELASSHNFLFPRNNDECTKTGQCLDSCYISEYNKMGSSDFIHTALPVYFQGIRDKMAAEGAKGLFVLQGQLTDGWLIFGPYSKEKTHDENMTAYIRALPDNEEQLALVNIIMRDFLTTDKCETIFALNYHKGLVREDCLAEFEQFLS